MFKELLSFATDIISKNNQNGLNNINQFTLKPEINWKRYYFEEIISIIISIISKITTIAGN